MDERNWVTVRTVGTDQEAELIAGFLRARELPVEVETLPLHQLPMTIGTFGEVRVKVPAESRPEAERLLAERDAAGAAAEALGES